MANSRNPNSDIYPKQSRKEGQGCLKINEMGCSNCGSGVNGKPAGCKSNGGCSSGGCNRMNVFDWLSTVPLQDGVKRFNIVEVSFNQGSRKDFYRNNTNQTLTKGDTIVLEGVGGFDMGIVNLTGELVKFQMKKYNVADDAQVKKVLRIASDDDLNIWNENKSREQNTMSRSRAIAKQLNLEMKICEVEIQADGKKGTFFYTADGRVDFRELIRIFASEFKMKIEMKQIGARQESGKVGGIGSCGRELCCSTWLTDFKSVNTTAARYQNLSINQTKLSGQCGRLKCCLNYELDTYLDALRAFPSKADTIETIKGVATLQKRDIFRNLMWYSFQGSNKQYPLTIERVKEIQEQNKNGIKPEELGYIEIETGLSRNAQSKTADMGFVNDVGQVSLKSLEKNKRSRQNRNKNKKSAHPNQPHANKTKDGNRDSKRPKQKSQHHQPSKDAAENRGPHDRNKRNENADRPKNTQRRTHRKPRESGGEKNKPSGD